MLSSTLLPRVVMATEATEVAEGLPFVASVASVAPPFPY